MHSICYRIKWARLSYNVKMGNIIQGNLTEGKSSVFVSTLTEGKSCVLAGNLTESKSYVFALLY